MLELILLWYLCNKMEQIMRDKGRRSLGYQAMLVGLWVAGETMGAITGEIVTGGGGMPTYLVALAGAAAGMVSAFMIARFVAPLSGNGPQPPTGGFPVLPATVESLDQRRY